MGLPILSSYQASKFALEGLSESILYELEPFGIKVVLIEPGIIKTNIMNSSIPARKALDPKSPYLTLMQKMESYFKNGLENESLPPKEVAKVVLEAVTSKNPNLRYTVGSDAANIIEARMKMSDNEFRSMIMKNFSIST
jgi:NAD(P)-dependent dehydrogenase (short-subunit alcohol dehydrogenase family)